MPFENPTVQPGAVGRPGLTPSLRSVSWLPLIAILLSFAFQLIAGQIHIMASMAVTQWVFILLPALWYWKNYRLDWSIFARVKPLKPRYIPTIILLALSTWIILFSVESLLLGTLAGFGFEPAVDIPNPETIPYLVIYILVIAVSAGICEEALFRGAIMPTVERHGVLPALLFSAALFSLTHLSYLNLISTFSLGIMIGLVVIKTGSLFAGVLYHSLNNFIAVIGMYFFGTVDLEALTAKQEAAALYLLLVLVSLALAGAFGGLLILQKQSVVKPLLSNRGRWFPRGWLNWATALMLIVFLILASLELLIGFGFFGPALGNRL